VGRLWNGYSGFDLTKWSAFCHYEGGDRVASKTHGLSISGQCSTFALTQTLLYGWMMMMHLSTFRNLQTELLLDMAPTLLKSDEANSRFTSLYSTFEPLWDLETGQSLSISGQCSTFALTQTLLYGWMMMMHLSTITKI
jgi:Na+-transporting NADH:ubiquinone oxidoreductase subunit NqrD